MDAEVGVPGNVQFELFIALVNLMIYVFCVPTNERWAC